MKSIYFALSLVLLLTLPSWGQQQVETETASTSDSVPRNLENEFQNLLRKSYSFREKGKPYEVVRQDRLIAFKNEVFDSLRSLQNQNRILQLEVNDKDRNLAEAQKNFTRMQQELDQLETEKENMQFLGIKMTKTGYRALSGSIIFCLLGGLVFFIYQYRHSNYITQQSRSAIAEMEHEFEQHRRWALEREQKLSRELLDERNKKRQTT